MLICFCTKEEREISFMAGEVSATKDKSSLFFYHPFQFHFVFLLPYVICASNIMQPAWGYFLLLCKDWMTRKAC